MSNYNKKQIEEVSEYFYSQLSKYNGEKKILFDEINPILLKKILFEQINNHYALRAGWQELYKKIDFSNISFDNVKVRCIDFTGMTGVKINPQTVYNKDLRGTKLNSVEIIGSFDGCVLSMHPDLEIFFDDIDGIKSDVINRISSIKK